MCQISYKDLIELINLKYILYFFFIMRLRNVLDLVDFFWIQQLVQKVVNIPKYKSRKKKHMHLSALSLISYF